jgi:hypothetical protein
MRPTQNRNAQMSEARAVEAVEADDAKLITLARAARARNVSAEGAAVRDDTGRTYVATTVELSSLALSALQAAVVIAVASGASVLEAAAVVSAETAIAAADLALVADLGAGIRVVLAGLDGAVRAVTSVG